jgi:hypothetical protein
VSLDVQVTTSTGQAFPDGVPIACSAKGQTWHGVTDTSAHVRFDIDAPMAVTELTVEFPQAITWLTNAAAEASRLRNAIDACQATWSLPDIKVISLAGNQNTYSTSVVAKPAIKVSAKFVDSAGNALPAFADRFGRATTLAGFLRDGVVAYPGVPKSEDGFVFVYLADKDEHRMCGRVLAFSAQQAQNDIDFGTITVDVPDDSGRINVTVTNVSALSATNRLVPAVTLFDTIGNAFYVLPADKNTGSTLIPRVVKDGRMPIPPGTYYVSPSTPAVCAATQKMIRLLRGGRSSVLDEGGIPRITISSQPVDTTIDGGDLLAKTNALVE